MVRTIRILVLLVAFAAQATGIIYARLVPTRYLAWAPYDQISFYRISVERAGHVLTPAEVEQRYHLPASGRENRAIAHVLAAIAQFESSYGSHDPVSTQVVYRVNGGLVTTWRPAR